MFNLFLMMMPKPFFISSEDVLTCARAVLETRPKMISGKPNRPIITGISGIPDIRSITPKVNRGWAFIPSMPICETIKPRIPEIQPFSGSVPAVSWPQIMTPNSASRKNSKAPNFRANRASGGVRSKTQSVPVSVPTQEDTVATKIPKPPSPR